VSQPSLFFYRRNQEGPIGFWVARFQRYDKKSTSE
jgi:hypothetical protein